MAKKIKKIVIIGPESTGKTTLCKKLSKKYKTSFVKEYARKYLTEKKRKYNYDDLLNIAKCQIEKEDKHQKTTSKVMFFDTNILTIKIWSEFKYKKCHPFINKQLLKRKYDLYILCNLDVPWKFDILRENEKNRDKIFNIYLDELKKQKQKFEILKKTYNSRFKEAEKICNIFLKNNN